MSQMSDFQRSMDTQHRASPWAKVLPFVAAVVFSVSFPLGPVLDLLGWVALRCSLISIKTYPIFCASTGMLISTLILFGIVRLWEREHWSSVGFRRPSLSDPFLGVGTALVKYALPPVTVAVGGHLDLPGPLQRITPTVPWGANWFLSFIVADVIFEQTSQAYVFERVLGFTQSRMLAAIFTVVLSIAMHIQGSGWSEAFAKCPPLLLLTLLYLWRRNIAVCLLAHFLMDTLLGLLDVHADWLTPWIFPPRVLATFVAGGALYWILQRTLRSRTDRG